MGTGLERNMTITNKMKMRWGRFLYHFCPNGRRITDFSPSICLAVNYIFKYHRKKSLRNWPLVYFTRRSFLLPIQNIISDTKIVARIWSKKFCYKITSKPLQLSDKDNNHRIISSVRKAFTENTRHRLDWSWPKKKACCYLYVVKQLNPI